MGREDAEKFVETLKKVFEGVATFKAEVIDIEADSIEEALEKIKIHAKLKEMDTCDCLACKITKVVDTEIEKEIILKGSIFKHCKEYIGEDPEASPEGFPELASKFKIQMNVDISEYIKTAVMLHILNEMEEKKRSSRMPDVR